MTTTVINIRDAPKGWQKDPTYVYIGRWHSSQKYGSLGSSKWRNPYGGSRISDDERDQLIAMFERYLLKNEELMRSLPELRDKTLICWCAPRQCHGDVLVRMVDGL